MIRSRVPDHANLIGRKIGMVAHAVYGAVAFSDYAETWLEDLKELPWVGFDDDHQYMPGQAWQSRLLGNRKSELRTNNGVVLANAIRGGNGVGVLPCFLGDTDPRLTRLSPILEEATTALWLLVHEDLRAVPKIRIVMDELIRLFRDRRTELEGRDPGVGVGARPTLVRSALTNPTPQTCRPRRRCVQSYGRTPKSPDRSPEVKLPFILFAVLVTLVCL